MKLKPLYDKIVVKQEDAEEKTLGGIILAPVSQEKPQMGIVVAVGHGRLDNQCGVHPLKIEVGNRVIFEKYSGVCVKIGEEDFLIFREDQILGIIE